MSTPQRPVVVVGGGVSGLAAASRLAEAGPPLRPEASEILQILSRWDGDMSPSSQGAAASAVLTQTVFESLFRLFRGNLGDVVKKAIMIPL